ncbi:RebB family R body protein [Pelomonas sp. UHG3]|jgi:hypothetical protein|uniref:RebB family R body protein n=1 Tax=Roseateles hydrophilus TaxID=2975054 RepID=A0ACC6C8C2_9BURK|nr:RebB family R body protein [Pelomonas sp. UHG3]MCY4744678.1 RebB family R body protein [Pelomonas sp. UHG3]
MAFPTSVNDQITDAVTQANVQVLSDAAAASMGALYQATAEALALAAQNASSQQQLGTSLAQAVTTRAITTLLGAAASKS